MLDVGSTDYAMGTGAGSTEVNKVEVTAQEMHDLLVSFYEYGFVIIKNVPTENNYIVNGTAKKIESLSNRAQLMQSGYIYHYALMMMLGLSIFLGFIIINRIGMAS